MSIHDGIPSHAHTKKIAILQRVLSASVTVDQQVVSSIGTGIVVFAAMAAGDTEKEADSMASKILKLKLWDDESGGRVWYQVSSIANPEPMLTLPCVLVEEKCPRHWRRGALR